jgi:hypothetical protein
MRFRLLLRDCGIAPEQVAVMLHTAREPALRDQLGALVEDAPELFEAYQSTHAPQAEATLRSRPIAASFISGSGSDMIFVGLYDVAGWEQWSAERLDADPFFATLRADYGATEFGRSEHPADRAGRLRFTLTKRAEISDLIGRLVIQRPAGRGYMRLAERMEDAVTEILRRPHLSPPAPEWRDFDVDAALLRALPRDWAARLREWRGVYLIVDQSDGARYVGAAYGDENLFRRWQDHVAKDRGVTAELKTRDPANFRFSILQVVEPDLDPKAVVAIESNWKKRLDTIRHGLNRQ